MSAAHLIGIDYRHWDGRHLFTSPFDKRISCRDVDLRTAFDAVTEQLNEPRPYGPRYCYAPALAFEDFQTSLVMMISMETEHFRPRLAARLNWQRVTSE